jgi:hypothetical protein
MDMLSGLGGLFGNDDERRQAQDFTRRYEQGAPWDGISDDEASSHYGRVASRLSPDEYESSAAEAFSRLDPQQRRELARVLRQQAQGRNVDLGDFDGSDDEYEDPRRLGRLTGRIQQQQPDLLGGLLGGMGGMGGGSGGGGGLLSSPIGKAALGGIAAMAMKRMMGGR